MSVRTKILDDIKIAMKNKENFKRDTLRMLNSSLKQVEVDERIELSDERVFAILQSEIKKRNDSALQYQNGGRSELAQKELDEIEIISSYLPAQISDEDLKIAIENLAKELNAQGPKDMGKMMKSAKEKFGASCDGKRLSDAIKQELNK